MEKTMELNRQLATEEVVWNLADLYKAPDDPAIAADMEQARSLAREAAACQGRVGDLSARELAGLVSLLEKMDQLVVRLATYGMLRFTIDTADAAASALLQRITELEAALGGKTIFFRLEWNSLADERADTILSDAAVRRYRHYLASLRRFAPYQLARDQEILLQELGPVGRSAWNLLFEKVMGQMRFGKARRSEEEVLSDLYAPGQEVRKQAASEMTEGLQTQLHVLTHVFNTLAAEKMIVDRLRGYPGWLSSMNLDNELEDNIVETLIGAVTSRYDLVHRYYRRKQELLGLDELFDYDRYAPVPGQPDMLISWPDCRKMVLDAFAGFSPRMAEIAEMFFERGWIHAPILANKRGGAFAHPCVPEVHPYVLVNYTGTLRDVSTVAHELGHGVHQYLAAGQGFYNADTPLVLAETASVFAELLVFKAQLELLDNEQERQAFLCQKIESIFATVFRQVAMNRFEDAMHNGRRTKVDLSADQLSAYWLARQKPMFGDSVTLRPDYGIWWAYIPHFLGTPGYVYSYAFGELLVLALYRRYQEEGSRFVDRYLALLAAGGSQSPAELLEPFGISLADPGFWQGGLDIIADMVADVE
jgi:oligoendopeptidase F